MRKKIRTDSKLYPFREEVARLYLAGLSTKEIGKKFSVDASNVWWFLKRIGIKTREQKQSLSIAIKRGRWNFKSGPKNHAWRGGITHHVSGYRLVKSPDHPRAHKNRGYVYEHILIAEKSIGRPLLKGEIVHHINHVKNDNRPENLCVMSGREHQKHHWKENRQKYLENLANARRIKRKAATKKEL